MIADPNHCSVPAWNGRGGMCALPTRHVECGRRTCYYQLHPLHKRDNNAAGPKRDFGVGVRQSKLW